MKAGTLGFGGDPYLRSNSHISLARISKERVAPAFSASDCLKKILDLEALQSSASDKKIQQWFGEKFAPQILLLAHEKDPAVFYQGLMNIGRDLEEEGHPACALLYSSLAELSDFQKIASQARIQLDALRGEGKWGPRLAVFSRELFDQSTDVPSLLGYVAGGITYRFVKGSLAGWLLASPASRRAEGFFAKSLAIQSGSLLTEAAVFTSTAKLSAPLVGRKIETDPKLWCRDWAGTALFLGNLRVFGFAAGQGGLALQEAGLLGKRAPWLLGQMGMYTGILAGHRLQSWAGFGTDEPLSNPFSSALGELLQFNAASLVSGRLVGKGVREWEQKLDHQTETLLKDRARKIFEPFDGGKGSGGIYSEAMADSLALLGPKEPTSSKIDKFFWEASFPRDESQGPEKITVTFSQGEASGEPHSAREKCRQDLGATATPAVLEALDGLEEIFKREGRFYRAIGATHVKDAKKLELALTRLWKILRSLNTDKAERNYADIVIAASITERFHRDRPLDLDPILKFYSEGGNIRDLEKRLAPDLQHQQLKKIPPAGSALALRLDIMTQIEEMPLSALARTLLAQYADVFMQPSANLRADPEKLVIRLQALHAIASHPVYVPLVEEVFQAAEASPVGGLRIGRLLRSSVHDNTDTLVSKLRELKDPDFQIVRPHFLLGLKVVTQRIDGTQFNAYYDDPLMARLFRRIYWDLNELLHPAKSAERLVRRDKILEDFWEKRNSQTPLILKEVVELFEKFGDAYSKRIAKDLKNKKIDLEFLSKEDFSKRVHISGRGMDFTQDWDAVYSPPGAVRPKGVVSVKIIDFDPADPVQRRSQTVSMLRSIVHEHRHSYNLRPGERRPLGLIVRQEVDSHAMEYYWSALHGDPKDLKMTFEYGSGGIALYLRHVMEYIFGGYFDQLKGK